MLQGIVTYNHLAKGTPGQQCWQPCVDSTGCYRKSKSGWSGDAVGRELGLEGGLESGRRRRNVELQAGGM